MRFYKIRINLVVSDDEEKDTPKSRRAYRDFGYFISSGCEKYTEKISDKGYFFLSNVTHAECLYGMVVRKDIDVSKFISDYVKEGKLHAEETYIRETTLYDFSQLLQDANRNEYIYDDDDVLREYELEDIVRHGPMKMGFSYNERLIKEQSRKTIYMSAKNYFTQETFIPELDRIFTDKKKKKVYGHPVDYMIESDDDRTQKGMTRLLIQALYNVGRIDNQRYCEVELEPNMNFYKRVTESLFKSCSGGAIVLSFCSDGEEDEDVAHGEYYYLEDLCSIIRQHCCDVLTIICLPRECKSLRMRIFENMGNCSFVEIKEELAVDDEAVAYLKSRAKEYKVRTDKNLLDAIEKGHGYLTPELNAIFDEWYSKKLKTTIYSQYKEISLARTEVKEKKPKGSAYDELENMIGLSSAKEILNQALDSYKAQVLFKDKGMKTDSICNHMIFTGNPGTAKTTVARLFARILKDNDVLSRGHIVEVGRGDLVGKYVGWTAPTIKKKFKEAVGGILFIDEAYSLVDDRSGSFGDEAINTIVQEMENHRDEVIVIFAGYPDEMEKFLDKNPGLRSRIAHYVHFEDYSCDELCQIACFIASQKDLVIDDDAMDKLREVMEEAKSKSDFGNGRYVRNVIEKARMAQSSRLVHLDYESVTPEDVKRICAEDIVIPMQGKKDVCQKIGFC